MIILKNLSQGGAHALTRFLRPCALALFFGMSAHAQVTNSPTEWLAIVEPEYRQACAEWRTIVTNQTSLSNWWSEHTNEVEYLEKCFVLFYETGNRIGDNVLAGQPGESNRYDRIEYYLQWWQSEGRDMMNEYEQGTLTNLVYERLLEYSAIKLGGHMNLSGPLETLVDTYVPQSVRDEMETLVDTMILPSSEELAVRNKTVLNQDLTEDELYTLQLRCATGHIQNHGSFHVIELQKALDPGIDLQMGDEFPDFRCITMEGAMNSTNYTDYYPHYPTHIFDRSVAMDGLVKVPEFTVVSNKVTPKALPPVVQDGTNYYRLSTALESQKPQAYFIVSAADDADSNKGFPALVALEAVYGDHIDIHWLCTIISEGALSEANFAGPPEDYSMLGSVGKNQNGHPYTMEERARSAKQKFLRFPNVGVSCLLENLGNPLKVIGEQFSFVGGGGNYISIIDANGKMWITIDRAVAYAGFGPPLQDVCVNAAERMFRTMITNNGTMTTNEYFFPNANMDGGGYRLYPKLSPDEWSESYHFQCKGDVIAKDEASNTVTIAAYADSKTKGTNTFEVLAETFIGERRTLRPMDFSELMVSNDSVNIIYARNKADTNRLAALMVYQWDRASDPINTGGSVDTFFGDGLIETIDTNNGVVSVRLNKDDLDRWKGYNYWETENHLTMWTEGDGAQENWANAVAFRSLCTNESLIDIKIEFDAGVYLNGNISSMDSLQAGQVATFPFSTSDFVTNRLTPRIFRASDKLLGRIIVSPRSPSVPEGSTTNLSVRLLTQPAATTTVTVSRVAGDTNITVSSAATLIYTTNDWNIPQIVTLSAAEDADWFNDTATIRYSADELYDMEITATERDDESGIELSTTTLTVDEGSTATFRVKLGLQPSAETTVTVAYESGDTDISVTGGSNLTFTTGDWDTYQTVTLSAAEDADWLNDSTVIRCASTGLISVDVTATEVDNETNPAHLLPFSEPFENSGENAVTNGPIDGQHGWAGGGTVQTGTVYGGSQALALTKETASHPFDGNASNIWITFWVNPVAGDAPKTISSDASAVFYVSTNNLLTAYNSTNAIEIADATILSNDWNKIAVSCDYVSKVWNLELNDAHIVTNFDFYGSPAAFQALEISEGTTNALFVDSITVTDTQNEPDEDGDSIPDSWEVTHYGSTNVSPTAMASNGLNTVLEAYIAGINPTNEQSKFLMSSVFNPQSSVLGWNATSGRVYSVFWSSNLLSGFQPLESNIAWTAVPYTDTNHPAEQKGFYKIEVQLHNE